MLLFVSMPFAWRSHIRSTSTQLAESMCLHVCGVCVCVFLCVRAVWLHGTEGIARWPAGVSKDGECAHIIFHNILLANIISRWQDCCGDDTERHSCKSIVLIIKYPTRQCTPDCGDQMYYYYWFNSDRHRESNDHTHTHVITEDTHPHTQTHTNPHIRACIPS